MIRGAIFDIDGVLLDSMPIWNDVGARYLRSIGVTPEDTLGGTLFRMTLEEGATYMKRHYALAQSEGDIRAGVLGVIEDFYRREVGLKPRAGELIDRFRSQGIPMVLATTSDRQLITAALERLGVFGCFSALFTASELHTGKHEPKIYETAAACLGTRPEETAVLEDALHAARTAKEAGFYLIGVYDEASAADREELERLADEFIV